ncbi:MAG: T9SS type A sorting domain-containing protein [Ignavibacteriales bacterium]|nr:T9SS type A sorting domain-containing protein [Ignavibacteriales bacterium]
MKKVVFVKVAVLIFFLAGFNPALQNLKADIPPTGNNKVAYYVFDSHGPDHLPLTSFTDEANIVVIFEGTLWELADSAHYSTGWMKNVVYQHYSEILRDIKILQARGVKVLMNVDDAPSWSTLTPFTTYDGTKLDYKQFAEFIKSCAIDSLHLDGISLDIEHRAAGNADYIALLKEIGKYFGPNSSNSNSQMYIAAIYAGYWGEPASVIGKSKDVAAYLNFVMDMAYFNSNYISRFNQWADYIGASKTMIGLLNDYNDLAFTTSAAAWQPASGPKAGIMVYAANNLKSYTDSVFKSLVVPVTDVNDNEIHEQEIPQEFGLAQNYPNPFNPSTTISYTLQVPGYTTLKVYDVLGKEIVTLADEYKQAGKYSVDFNIAQISNLRQNLSSGIYFYTLRVGDSSSLRSSEFKTKKMLLIK